MDIGEGLNHEASPAAQEVKVAFLRKDRRKHAGGRRSQDSAGDKEALSPETIRELRRRLRDSRDPVRYMLVSEFSRRFMLYYNVSSHTFAMNEPSEGTLFKRREAAESVKKILSKGVSIVKYTTKGGKLKRLSPYSGRWMSGKQKYRRV